MTREQRRKRALRNERRGRNPQLRTEIPESPRALYFRYGGYVVRVLRGELRVARPFGRPVRAIKGQYPRATMIFAPLPAKWREEIALAALQETRRQRNKRLKDMGLDLPVRDVYQDPVAVPTGAWS